PSRAARPGPHPHPDVGGAHLRPDRPGRRGVQAGGQGTGRDLNGARTCRSAIAIDRADLEVRAPPGSHRVTKTMKALAKTKPAEGLELIDAPIPTPGDEDVLIKVHRTAVCGTDIHIWNWDEWSQKNVPVPMITVHEFSGEIVAIGADVDRRLNVGQRVSAEGHVIDLNSEAARAGHFHLDPATKGIGVNRQGAFAEYVVAPAFNVIELP